VAVGCAGGAGGLGGFAQNHTSSIKSELTKKAT